MDPTIAAYEHAYTHGIDAELADCRRQKQSPVGLRQYPLLEVVPATPELLIAMGWPLNWGIKWALVPGREGE